MMLVTGAEEARRAAKQALAAPVPADALAGPERFGDLGFVKKGGCDHIADRTHENRTVLVSERQRLLGQHREFLSRCVIFDVAGCSLRRQPFANIALGRAGGLREFRGIHRSVRGERLVETELVADQPQRCIEGRAVAAVDRTVSPRWLSVRASVSNRNSRSTVCRIASAGCGSLFPINSQTAALRSARSGIVSGNPAASRSAPFSLIR